MKNYFIERHQQREEKKADKKADKTYTDTFTADGKTVEIIIKSDEIKANLRKLSKC